MLSNPDTVYSYTLKTKTHSGKPGLTVCTRVPCHAGKGVWEVAGSSRAQGWGGCVSLAGPVPKRQLGGSICVTPGPTAGASSSSSSLSGHT